LISFHPGIQALRKAFGRPWPDLEAAATDRWTIAPAVRRHVAPARFLPGQLDRVRGVDFGSRDEVVASLRGGFDCTESETLGFHLRDIELVDGVLYAPGAIRHLRGRRRRSPIHRTPTEVTRGALYESWVGNRWFGNWLLDDCLTYRLAERFGMPVTTAPRAAGHMARYERLLGIAPRRVDAVRFEELIIFGDLSHNQHKAARADQLRTRLTGASRPEPHAGVFLLRGEHGQRRVLRNEQAIAETLRRDRGFRIMDPMASTADELIAACAGAQVIAGVEGSHLVHGIMVMPPGAVLFVIQPPGRVLSVLKMTTDRQGQVFAFVIGEGPTDDFTARWDEIDRTLDMALS
jgi:capsular polysaccharide biosynthesis protein